MTFIIINKTHSDNTENAPEKTIQKHHKQRKRNLPASAESAEIE